MQVLQRAYNLVTRIRLLRLYALVLVLGVVGIALGGWYAWHAIDVQRTGLRVEGRVVSVRETSDDPARYEPTYEYRVDGEAYRIWGSAIVLVVFGVLCFWALWFRTLRRRR